MTPRPSIEPRYTPEQAIDELRLPASPRTLRRAIREGKLSAEKLGRKYVVTEKAIQDYLKKCRVVVSSPDYTSEAGPTASRSGKSETDQNASRRGVLRAIGQGLKNA